MPPGQVSFEGIKVQLKGRMGGKGGKASKRVWVWGRTSASDLRDPVDYAHEAVVTRAGYIGIKVRAAALVSVALAAWGTLALLAACCGNGLRQRGQRPAICTRSHTCVSLACLPIPDPAAAVLLLLLLPGVDPLQALAHGSAGATQHSLRLQRTAGAGDAAAERPAQPQQQRLVEHAGPAAAAAAPRVGVLCSRLRRPHVHLEGAAAAASARGRSGGAGSSSGC